MTPSKTVNKPFYLDIKAQPYRKQLVFCIADDLMTALAHAKKKLGAQEQDLETPSDAFLVDAQALAFRKDNGSAVLLFSWDAMDCVVLVHEIEHAVNNIFGSIGFQWDKSSCEAWAYMKDYIFETFCRAYTKAGHSLPLFRD